MKIAIYSANFGNYRNELNYIHNKKIYFDKDIDYYFFTENLNVKSKKWKIIFTNLQNKLSFMNKYRHTNKYIKWIVPDILKTYDIIIWIDSSWLRKWTGETKLKFKKDNIIKLFNKNENNIYFNKHPSRDNPLEELNTTVARGVENKKNFIKFKNIISNIKFKSKLPACGCMIYKNNNENIKILKEVYNMLMYYEFRRDQNVLQYTFFKENFESKICFFHCWDCLNGDQMCKG
jgi:hypothetical protein